MARSYTTSWASQTDTLTLPVFAVPASTLTLVSEAADTVKEVLISGPLDRPETWEFARKDVQNVYSDTTVSASTRPTSSRGAQIMVKHSSFVTVTDSEDAAFVKYLPLVSWTCVRVPINELMTSDLVLDEVKRMAGGLLSDQVSSARINQLIQGALRAQ